MLLTHTTRAGPQAKYITTICGYITTIFVDDTVRVATRGGYEKMIFCFKFVKNCILIERGLKKTAATCLKFLRKCIFVERGLIF